MRLEHEYVARKLTGEATEVMPVTEPTKFELVISFKTANQIGLTISSDMLARANKVIR
jgi:putative ABC transport system substrate-binding protein